MMIPASDTAMANPMEGEAPVETLVRRTADARCLRSTDDRLYVRVPADARREVHAIRSSAFYYWLNPIASTRPSNERSSPARPGDTETCFAGEPPRRNGVMAPEWRHGAAT